MMKKMRKTISLLVAMVMVLSLCPVLIVPAVAAEPAVLTVEMIDASVGSEVSVNVSIADNPGVMGGTLTLTYDPGLTLTGITNGAAFSTLTMTAPGNFASGCKVLWDAVSEVADSDGVILRLAFTVAEDAAAGETQNISVTVNDLVDNELNTIASTVTNGGVRVIEYIPGDLNGDGTVSVKDVIALRRHITGGWGVTINEFAADVNDDDYNSVKDVILIRRFIVGGHGVELKAHTVRDPENLTPPGKTNHSHTLEHIAYLAPDCTNAGNVEYYYCADCGRYYADAVATTEITKASTVLPATGHTVVTIPYLAPTTTSEGHTEGSYCSVCGAVFKKSEPIPVITNDYSVEYYFTESDPYLQKLAAAGTLVNPAENVTSYSSGDSKTLKNLNVPGYTFEGWYDGQGSNAIQIKKLDSSVGSIQLYAHWNKLSYTITFDSPDVPVSSLSYSVDTGATLTNPSMFGYTFVGWSNDGKIVSSIPVGSIGNIILHANWTSNRNKATSVRNPSMLGMIEDRVSGQYLFIYEIGEIQNVPLSLIENLGNTDGISISRAYGYTHSVSSSFAQKFSSVLAEATSTTSSWTLSSDWNSSTSAMRESEEQNSKTNETTDSQGNTVASQYYVSNVKGGETSTTSNAGGSSSVSAKVTTGASTGTSQSYSDTKTKKKSGTLEVSGGYSAGPWKVGGKASGTISHEDEHTDAGEKTRTDSVGTEGSVALDKNWNTSGTTSSSWNTSESYESSASASENHIVSEAISQVITEKTGISSTLSEGGGESHTDSSTANRQYSEEYASTVEYDAGNSEEFSTNVTQKSNASGWYRLVTAGNLHVFAVVGYDIATNSYFTYTYNILDDARYTFLDFSMNSSSFNDCENAVLSFEVPYEVNEFMSQILARSEGLVIDDNGVVTGYTGDAEYVVIPEYISQSDDVSRPTAVKVAGIAAKAFAGKTLIKGVYLPKFISSIPDGAFENCTSLETVVSYGVTKIGRRAFAGCISLKTFILDEYIDTLGETAFTDCPEIKVTAANTNVADAAIGSGAMRITLDVSGLSHYDKKTITLSDSTDYFAFIGNGGEYSSLVIESDAAETYVGNVTFIENETVPLQIGSSTLNLSKVRVNDSPSYSMILTGENVRVALFGTNAMSSADGNAVLSKNATLTQMNPGTAGTLTLTGNYLVSGTLTENGLLSFNLNSGKVITIGNEQLTVTLNANGGELDKNTVGVYAGQPYGTLPEPTCASYRFDGWFTEAEGGEKISADTIVTATGDYSLYAHWTLNTFTITFDAGEGSVDTSSMTAACSVPLGDLPVANRDYYTFDGWFTEAEGGKQITADTVINAAEDFTVYAHWTIHETQGWTLASDVPGDARIEEEKWSYTQRNYTTSGNSQMNGWTLYDTQRTSWGATQGPVYSDPSNGSRNVWSEQYVTSSNYKTIYVYHRWTSSSADSGNTYSYDTGYDHVYRFDYPLTLVESSNWYGHQTYKYYYNAATGNTRSGNYKIVIYSGTEQQWVSDNYGTRWYYQEPEYTYYFYQDVNLESYVDPSSQSDVSNVQKWVRFIEK